jgi:UDP-N-acetylmuramyl pentapeptide phosphotransferase/UDP-N-acetylglucosamine-1-phosphate transferase
MKYIYYLILATVSTTFLIYFLQRTNFFKKKLATADEFVLGKSKKKKISGIGISFLIIFLLTFLAYHFLDEIIIYPNRFEFFVLALTTITLISFVDDLRNLNPIYRLIAHFLCVYISISALNLNNIPLPLKVSILLALVIWVYFINITNFIDGSDGFCAIHTINFFLGILLINYLFNINLFSAVIAKVLLPIIVVFLFFNFPVAKVYMGDAGSIFLGFLVGYSFLELSVTGHLFYALSLYAYPIIDCTICILIKFFRGYLPWERHGDYFFLKIKKKIPEKYMFYASAFIFFTGSIQCLINLLIIFLSIKFNNLLLLVLCFINSFSVMLIYKLTSIQDANFLKRLKNLINT